MLLSSSFSEIHPICLDRKTYNLLFVKFMLTMRDYYYFFKSADEVLLVVVILESSFEGMGGLNVVIVFIF